VLKNFDITRMEELMELWEKYCPSVDVDFNYIVRWSRKTPVEYNTYYDSGIPKFKGHAIPVSKKQLQEGWPEYLRYGEGSEYYEDGTLRAEGFFQTAGLLFGRFYYPSGKLEFEGKFNDKVHSHETYYGPSYPVYGRFYLETGELEYEGEFEVEKQGNVGYPRILYPGGFSSL